MNRIDKYLSEKDLIEIQNIYSQSHRYFHTFDHVQSIIKLINSDMTTKKYGADTIQAFILAALFHDIVYDPTNHTENETESVKYMKPYLQARSVPSDIIDLVEQLIIGTNAMVYNEYTILQYLFNTMDRHVLHLGLSELIEYGDNIWKEYSFMSRSQFLKSHIHVIDNLAETNTENLNAYKTFIKKKKIRLAIYPGSFNPFHKGHEYIVNEASKLFDKVIIAVGENPDKVHANWEFHCCTNQDLLPNVKYFETVKFTGMLSDLVSHYEKEGYDVTIVKGIRDGMDLDYENKQRLFLKDFKNDLKYAYIPCSNDYSYISSSSIRVLKTFGKDISKYVSKGSE